MTAALRKPFVMTDEELSEDQKPSPYLIRILEEAERKPVPGESPQIRSKSSPNPKPRPYAYD